MPKAEKGSLKDLSKRMKAKGLQKLKFYCQMCEKQCRDANGFKCHLASDSHLRNMKIFSENSSSILYRNSKQFEKIFLDTLRMRHSTAQVNANQVYQQVISDKAHVHMNGTYWSSLSGFVQYLGKTGKCHIQETERGWYITYINRDVDKMQREEEQQKRQAAELQAEAELQRRILLQRKEAAKALDRAGIETSSATAMETDRDTKIAVALVPPPNSRKRKQQQQQEPTVNFGDKDDEDDDTYDKEGEEKKVRNKKKKASSKEQDRLDTASRDQDYSSPWLYQNIVVRIINKDVANGQYFRKKAIVDQLVDKYTAQVTTLDDSSSLRLDQDDLETVVPKIKKMATTEQAVVRIVRGTRRGQTATVVHLDKKEFVAELQMLDGQRLKGVPFEDFSSIP